MFRRPTSLGWMMWFAQDQRGRGNERTHRSLPAQESGQIGVHLPVAPRTCLNRDHRSRYLLTAEVVRHGRRREDQIIARAEPELGILDLDDGLPGQDAKPFLLANLRL